MPKVYLLYFYLYREYPSTEEIGTYKQLGNRIIGNYLLGLLGTTYRTTGSNEVSCLVDDSTSLPTCCCCLRVSHILARAFGFTLDRKVQIAVLQLHRHLLPHISVEVASTRGGEVLLTSCLLLVSVADTSVPSSRCTCIGWSQHSLLFYSSLREILLLSTVR